MCALYRRRWPRGRHNFTSRAGAAGSVLLKQKCPLPTRTKLRPARHCAPISGRAPSKTASPALALGKQRRVDLPEQRHKSPRRRGHLLVPGLAVCRQIREQIRIHHQRRARAELSHGLESRDGDLRPRPVVDEGVDQLPQRRLQGLGRHAVVRGLHQRREQQRDVAVVRRELALDPRVEVGQQQPVSADGAGEDAGSREPRVVARERPGDCRRRRSRSRTVVGVLVGASASASDAGKEALGKGLFFFFLK